MSGYATEHVTEVIVWLDWLQGKGSLWNFRECKLTLDGETYLLLDSTKRMFCRRLILQEPVIVTARSQVDLPTRVVSHSLAGAKLHFNDAWISEDSGTEKGVHISRTVVPPRTADISLRAMNVSDTDVRLDRGTNY